MDKTSLVNAIAISLKEKLLSFENMLSELNTAIAEDTKSSAGDKFETSRAMAQQEIDKVHQQQSEIKRQLALLTSLPPGTEKTISAGSLVETDKGNYFIGVPSGQINFDGKTIYCISSASPLAQQLIGKTENDQIIAGSVSQKILKFY